MSTFSPKEHKESLLWAETKATAYEVEVAKEFGMISDDLRIKEAKEKVKGFKFMRHIANPTIPADYYEPDDRLEQFKGK